MKIETITAIEFLKAKAKKQLIENFKEFIDIIKMSNDWAKDNMFWIDESDATLEINIDENFFEIDNQGLESWCESNTMFKNLSDKRITILNLVKQ
tara:strand:+ start:170 stop:454 length:285 start_codon:yes stop_codon:yes gene_type:complete